MLHVHPTPSAIGESKERLLAVKASSKMGCKMNAEIDDSWMLPMLYQNC